MDNIEPSEAAIIAATSQDDETPQELTLVIRMRVTNEQRLRRIASERMSRSGFGGEPADHADLPLAELAYEAMYGSNSDALGPDLMGIEIVSSSAG